MKEMSWTMRQCGGCQLEPNDGIGLLATSTSAATAATRWVENDDQRPYFTVSRHATRRCVTCTSRMWTVHVGRGRRRRRRVYDDVGQLQCRRPLRRDWPAVFCRPQHLLAKSTTVACQKANPRIFQRNFTAAHAKLSTDYVPNYTRIVFRTRMRGLLCGQHTAQLATRQLRATCSTTLVTWRGNMLHRYRRT